MLHTASDLEGFYTCKDLSIYDSTALVDIGYFFTILICTQSVGLLGRGSASRKTATDTQNNTQIKRTQTSMPRVGLKPTNLAFDRAKTVNALDLVATVISMQGPRQCKMYMTFGNLSIRSFN
jgi:hypothetical protein